MKLIQIFSYFAVLRHFEASVISLLPLAMRLQPAEAVPHSYRSSATRAFRAAGSPLFICVLSLLLLASVEDLGFYL